MQQGPVCREGQEPQCVPSGWAPEQQEDTHEEEVKRPDAEGAPDLEGAHVDLAFRSLFPEQQRCDKEAAQDEEEIDAEGTGLRDGYQRRG